MRMLLKLSKVTISLSKGFFFMGLVVISNFRFHTVRVGTYILRHAINRILVMSVLSYA
jgi:hypothetical protein